MDFMLLIREIGVVVSINHTQIFNFVGKDELNFQQLQTG